MAYKNKFNLNYWLRKFYTSRFFQLLPINKSRLKKRVFTSIYKSNHWVQDDDILPKENISISGHGSNTNTEQFYNLEKNLNDVIENYNIKSILDMPCGDFLWMKEILKNKKINYLGIDIVEELIKKNNIKFKTKNIEFENHDIVNFFSERSFDLIIIRDLFIHIDNSDILRILNNIKDLDFKYIALNSYENEINENVIIGKHRKINLLAHPFNLKKPFYFFKDFEKDKNIFLYKKSDLI